MVFVESASNEGVLVKLLNCTLHKMMALLLQCILTTILYIQYTHSEPYYNDRAIFATLDVHEDYCNAHGRYLASIHTSKQKNKIMEVCKDYTITSQDNCTIYCYTCWIGLSLLKFQ